MVGSFTWNEEAAGSNPVSYTIWAVMFQGWRKTLAMFLEEFNSLTVHNRFVGVTANITDCRSVAMGSIPVRTAEYY